MDPTTPNAPTARERVDDSCHEQALELLHGELRTSADGGTWRAPLTREQVKAMCREYDSLHAALLAARDEITQLRERLKPRKHLGHCPAHPHIAQCICDMEGQ